MVAGRELDALVAEKVMGLKLDYEFAGLDELGGAPMVPALRDQYDEWGILPEYSTDIAAAWEVVDEMGRRYWYASYTDLSLDTGKPWHSWHFTDHESVSGTSVRGLADAAPLAICLAALKAVGVEL